MTDLDPEFESDARFLLPQDDAGARIMELLNQKYPSVEARDPKGFLVWNLSGKLLYEEKRYREALNVYWELYQKLLGAQTVETRLGKTEPLLQISDCFSALKFPVHAKRYRMLALCERAIIRGGGPNDAAEQLTVYNDIYSRLVWGGLTEQELKRYAKDVYAFAQQLPQEAIFPEALLLRLDDNWAIELPSVNEVMYYRVNPAYVHHLLPKLGEGGGEALEFLAQYLMSCMPGCRAKRRVKTLSTDHDVVCAMEGFNLDFRSELGRYFVCECKDWNEPADFTTMAKFCRVLDSTKSRFGILFSKKGISGIDNVSNLKATLIACERRLLACAVQRRRFPVGANPTRQPLQPEAIGAVMEATKWLKPSISVSRIGDSASDPEPQTSEGRRAIRLRARLL